MPLELDEGRGRPGNPLDIARLQEDTGYRRECDTADAAVDYAEWLRSGHER